MYVLGVSCFYHDAAAALLKDGMLVAAVEEERFSRKKHDFDFPVRAIRFCLQRAGITAKDLDYVVFYEKPFAKFDRILTTTLASFPRSWEVFGESMITWFHEKLWIKKLLQERVGVPSDKVLFVDHHMTHAASAFLCSPFREAATLTVDGVGEWATASLGHARGTWNEHGDNRISLSHELSFPHSLGLLYSVFTAFLGFEVNEGEYKVMGMAPFGQPRYLDRIERMVKVFDDGSIWLDMDYFAFHYSTKYGFSKRFLSVFGEPRPPEEEFVTSLTHPDVSPNGAQAKRNQYYADIAASIQTATEDILLRMAASAHRQTGLKALCMAGGVALNSVANGRILRESPFEEFFIQPAPGDSGGALGAALYAWHVLLGRPRHFIMEHAYWGAEYPGDEIQHYLRTGGLSYEVIEDEARLIDRVVDELSHGKVVGWFQGRFEWGPRALGNRSILADPRNAEMKHIVNAKIKFREPFRPFAPVIPEERAHEYFDSPRAPHLQYPARYMLLVLPWREDAGARVPAVNHLGTGRLQTIREEWNPRYYRLVRAFGEATGVPVLLNTSFNVRGEPIVATPGDALRTFAKSHLDVLVLDQCVVSRDKHTT